MLSFGFGSRFMVIDGRFQFEIQIELVSELEMVAGWGGFGGGGRQESAEFKQGTKSNQKENQSKKNKNKKIK